ncbi:MAG: hypothetical protein Q7R40_05440 [Phaeospirillum sp.]|nr:hypothetical protein [Phaeospirillum sp.]
MGKPVTSNEQEALFQAIIRKLPSVVEPSRLQEVSTLALALMLRRPGDRDLRAELTREIHDIIAEVKPGHPPEAIHNEMRFAVRGCIKVLQAAKERRLPRKAQAAANNWAQSDGARRTVKPVHHKSEDEDNSKKTTRSVVAVLLALLVLLGGYIWWSGARTDGGSDPSEAGRFARQVMDAAKGDAPETHMFGGSLRVVSMGGRPVVVAEKVPPRICAASGWTLVRGGVLSINGVTPQRVSSGKITELCNSEDGDASIMWSPK